MSATNRGAVRLPQDAYDTPEWCVRALLREWHPTGERWLEPCVGNGNILRAVQATLPPPASRAAREWTVFDVRENVVLPEPSTDKLVTGLLGVDFLNWGASYSGMLWDAAIMNPPYSFAEAFVRRTLRYAREVAALLRLGFLSSQKRAEWLRESTPDVYVLPKRPSFTGKGTDATDYGWFVWRTDEARTEGKVRILEVEDG